MANSIVQVQDINGVLLVDSRLIAEDLGIRHSNFLATLEKHKATIESAFGTVLFETEGLNGLPGYARYALLTEGQSTLLMTFSRNTDRVIKCKVKLVQAFSQAKKMIEQPEKKTSSLRALQEVINGMVLLEDEQDRQSEIIAQQQVLIAQNNFLIGKQEESISLLRGDVDAINQARGAAVKELESFPTPSVLAPEETADMKIRRLVNNYCRRTGSTQAECFRRLYQDDYYRNHRKVESRKKKNESVIQAYVRLGWADSLYSLAIDLFAENKITAIDSRKPS